MPVEGPVLLYDGVCGMCQATVSWMLRHDARGNLRFAPQQGAFGAEVMARHSLDKDMTNSAMLVCAPGSPDERIVLYSDAILGSLATIGGVWGVVARVARVIPRFLRNAVYAVVARNRIRFFGTADLCALPTPEQRARFIESDVQREVVLAGHK